MPSEKRSVLGEQVYRKIRKMILAGELKPGEKIPEHKLVTELEVSRTPVREAMRRLAGDGLIVFQPNHSAVVVRIDREYVKELGIVRVALDCLSVILATRNGRESDFEELERLSQAGAVAEAEEDISQVISISGRFHKLLVKSGGNHVLTDLQVQFYRRAKFVQSMMHRPYELESHLLLVKALRRRDGEAAVNTMLSHLCRVYQLDVSEIQGAIETFRIIAGIKEPIPGEQAKQEQP